MDTPNILKINDRMILNFLDLQENFSPWELYEQRQVFVSFARIHCCPLTTWITGDNGSMDPARYLDKAFWLDLLCMEPRDGVLEPMALLHSCLEDLRCGELQQQEAAARIAQELSALQVAEKLAHIRAAASLTAEEASTALVLLALCELAETDARKQDLQRWNAAPEEPAAPGEQTPEETVSEAGVPEFPDVDKLVLKTRPEPYRYLYHEADALTQGTIRTVRIEAAARSGQHLRLHLCGADGTVRLEVELKAGEYRDCTVADNRFIRLLPTLSISDTLCLARKDYSSTEITVIPRSAPEWVLNVDSSTARKISCFAAGDNATEGFLYLRNGKLMKGFYKPNENYSLRQQLEMVDERLVEVRLSGGCYRLLTEHGEILSNDPSLNGKQRVLSLYPRGEETCEHREVAVNDSGSATAIHGQDDRCAVLFGQ